MSGAKGSALEWALALLRAPGERHVLRQRPLPQDDMDLLLGIAAGATPEVLAEQARRFGESEARVVEAARFYAREVLFHPQADAYRMLGVEPGAGAEEIKAHHRLLQLWLHPDRARSEDDAVFAARVNGAWNRLRSPERRQAYDEALRAERPPELFDSSGTLRSVRTWVPAAEPPAPPSPWRRRWPALALLALCGALALLALRDIDRTEADWDAAQSPAASAGTADIDPIAPLVLRAGADPASVAQPASFPNRIAVKVPGAVKAAPRPAVPAPGAGAHPQADMVPASFAARRRAARETSLAEAGAGSETAAAAVSAPLARHGDNASAQPAPVHPAVVGAIPAPAPADAPPAASSLMQQEFARVQSARLTGEQLLDYLRTPRRPAPPIWSSPAVEEVTQGLRNRLHAERHVRLSDPRWRIGGNQAVLESTVSIGTTPARSDQLTARLRWRDGYWLVTGVEMESVR